MKRLRWFQLALLVVYTAMLIGMQFHSHPAGQDPMTAHCKSCHVSQTAYDSVQAKDLHVAQPVLHYHATKAPAFLIRELQESTPGRAPPLS